MKTATKKTAKAPAIADMSLPIGQLVDAPYNPRKEFVQAELEEMAGTMKEHGVLEPLVVRPLEGGNGKKPSWEIISGHKRLRAARMADLKCVPCRIHQADDKQALALAIVANLHSNPNPLEQAAAYRELMATHGLSVEKAADFLGESIGTIRALVKLKNLPEIAEQAVKEGRLPVKTAGLISSLPEPEQRERFTLNVLSGLKGDGVTVADIGPTFPPLTFVEAQELIKSDFQRQLKGVPWKLADAKLLPGAGSCVNCPKKAGNAAKEDPDTYGDLRGDMCLDVACFKMKQEAHVQGRIAEAQAGGQKVITGSEAERCGRFPSNWLLLDGQNALTSISIPEGKTLREWLKEKGVELEGIRLAIAPNGQTAEVVAQDWVFRQLQPPPPPRTPPPEAKSKSVKEKPPEAFRFVKPEVGTDAPEEEEEDRPALLVDKFSVEEQAAFLAQAPALEALGNLFSGLSCGEGITRALRAAALAYVERDIEDYNGNEVEALEAERGIEPGTNPQDEVVFKAWALWIAGASASQLLTLLCASPVRWALRCLPATHSALALLDAAGLNWDEFLAEARKKLEPETIAS